MVSIEPLMIATCWTSAGNVKPLDADERSPFDILDRVNAAADAGWRGIGFGQDDLRQARDTIGFASLREHIAASGMRFIEVEFLNDWWGAGQARERSDDVRALVLDAAAQLGAARIKVGTAFDAEPSLDLLVKPLRELSSQAADHGTRVALEPMPFSMVTTVPRGAELVQRVGHPACGVLVDSWHVHRAGTTHAELRACLSPELLGGVELDDADEQVVGTLFEDTINNRRLCGEGVIDIPGLVRTMREIGYDGGWGVEIISTEHRARSLEDGLKRAYETARASILAAG